MITAIETHEASLYKTLSEPAPASSVSGETNTTKAKETVDNDVEMLVLEEDLDLD
jgi:hypothetical protein